IDDIASHLTNGTIRALPPVTFPGVTNSNDLVQALLPELFPDHERLVVIPAAAEVRTDIAELAATDLDEALLAAKHDVRTNRSSGLTLMRRTASAFGDDHVGALKYVFASHAEMNDDFAPFDPQIAVLNPSALREDGVTQRVIGLLSEVTISFVDALLTVVRGRYADLDGDWNVRAQWETSADPKIVNWRGQTRHYGHMALSR